MSLAGVGEVDPCQEVAVSGPAVEFMLSWGVLQDVFCVRSVSLCEGY